MTALYLWAIITIKLMSFGTVLNIVKFITYREIYWCFVSMPIPINYNPNFQFRCIQVQWKEMANPLSTWFLIKNLYTQKIRWVCRSFGNISYSRVEHQIFKSEGCEKLNVTKYPKVKYCVRWFCFLRSAMLTKSQCHHHKHQQDLQRYRWRMSR